MNKRVDMWLAILFIILGLVEVAVFIDTSEYVFLLWSFTMFTFAVRHLIKLLKKDKAS